MLGGHGQQCGNGCVFLGPGTLKSASSQLKNKLMNWADLLHAKNDVIIFG